MRLNPISLFIPILFQFVEAGDVPMAVETVIEGRNQAIKKIDKVYVQELEKLKLGYTKKGDLKNANLVDELIKGGHLSDIEPPKLDGKWHYVIEGQDKGVIRVFNGGVMIDEQGTRRSFKSQGNLVTIPYSDGQFEKLTLDAKNPDVISGTNHNGTSFVYTRVK